MTAGPDWRSLTDLLVARIGDFLGDASDRNAFRLASRAFRAAHFGRTFHKLTLAAHGQADELPLRMAAARTLKPSMSSLKIVVDRKDAPIALAHLGDLTRDLQHLEVVVLWRQCASVARRLVERGLAACTGFRRLRIGVRWEKKSPDGTDAVVDDDGGGGVRGRAWDVVEAVADAVDIEQAVEVLNVAAAMGTSKRVAQLYIRGRADAEFLHSVSGRLREEGLDGVVVYVQLCAGLPEVGGSLPAPAWLMSSTAVLSIDTPLSDSEAWSAVLSSPHWGPKLKGLALQKSIACRFDGCVMRSLKLLIDRARRSTATTGLGSLQVSLTSEALLDPGQVPFLRALAKHGGDALTLTFAPSAPAEMAPAELLSRLCAHASPATRVTLVSAHSDFSSADFRGGGGEGNMWPPGQAAAARLRQQLDRQCPRDLADAWETFLV